MQKKNHLHNKYVIQKNELLYGDTSLFTIDDLKIFRLVISKVNSQNLLFEDFYEITNDELKDLKLKESHLYQNTLTSLKKLANIYVPLEVKGEDGKVTSIKEVGLIQNNFEFKKYSRKFYVSFHKDLKKYLLQIKGGFTKYPIIEITDLDFKYSLKLYEYLRSTNLTVMKVGIEKLKKRLDVKSASYSVYGNFNNKILKAAINQINNSKTCNMHVECEPIKDGRKIIQVQFRITRNGVLTGFKKKENTYNLDLIKLQKYENKIIVMEDQSYIINEVNIDTISITIANKENKNDVMEKKFGSIDDMEKELKSLNYE
ncbi:MAG: hypothetical protein COA66_10290 [Arcobacter sp.]|nr:MAG: hypothetical protein COA66_10290 [Arcobacter sp.]